MQVRVISAIVEGMSIRATARMTDVHQDTIGRLALAVGQGCARLHDRLFRDLRCATVELDEIWSFCGKKQKRCTDADLAKGKGDAWTFVAFDLTSRAVISTVTGKRTGENAEIFTRDVRARVLGTPVILSDGFKPYVDAVEAAFGADVRFGMLVKQYEGDERAGARNGHYKGAVPVVVQGALDPSEINTSLVERQNLTMRMGSRRFTRKTNAFSKKPENHAAAVWLYVAHYNLCRPHESLGNGKWTPAMQLGIEDRPWSIAELISAALAEPERPPAPPAVQGPPAVQLPLRGVPFLRLIQGGKK